MSIYTTQEVSRLLDSRDSLCNDLSRIAVALSLPPDATVEQIVERAKAAAEDTESIAKQNPSFTADGHYAFRRRISGDSVEKNTEYKPKST